MRVWIIGEQIRRWTGPLERPNRALTHTSLTPICKNSCGIASIAIYALILHWRDSVPVRKKADKEDISHIISASPDI